MAKMRWTVMMRAGTKWVRVGTYRKRLAAMRQRSAMTRRYFAMEDVQVMSKEDADAILLLQQMEGDRDENFYSVSL